MAAYAQRHYGIDSYTLTDPKVIVEHYTVTPNSQFDLQHLRAGRPRQLSCMNFRGPAPTSWIDKDGTIYQLVPLDLMCRHTVGLNYTAIGIEHVGMSDQQVMDDSRQLQASLELTRWLRRRYGITIKNVIGHSEIALLAVPPRARTKPAHPDPQRTCSPRRWSATAGCSATDCRLVARTAVP